MNRVLRLAALQTVIFVSVVFFFYVASYGIRSVVAGSTSEHSWTTHAFWGSSLIGMLSTVQVLLRSGRAIYPWVAIGSSIAAAIAVFAQGVAPLLALVPAMNAAAIVGFQRQRRTV